MKHPNSNSGKNSVARCRNLNPNGSFHLPPDGFECRICPFRVQGNGGIHIVATATITSPTTRTGEFIEVVCQSQNWYRSYLYEEHGNVANIDVIMFTDTEGRSMTPGTYSVAFRLNRPVNRVTIRVDGALTRRANQPRH
jgi:hypothetical protein